MKKLLKNSVFRLLIIIFGNISVVVFLFGYMMKNSLTSPITKVLTIALFAVFMLIFTITMYCELCFDEASKSLVIDGDLEKAHTWISRMKRVDLFGWYKTQRNVFMTLYYLDMDLIDDLAVLLKDRDFSKNPSNQLVYDYNRMLVGIHNNNAVEVEDSYSNLKSAYKQKSKKKIALIYSFDMISATYNYYKRDYKAMKNSLDRISMGNLNNREQSHVNYLRYSMLFSNGNKIKAKAYFDKAKSLYPQGKFIKEIEG